jgi:DnaJ-class molecular chaperone
MPDVADLYQTLGVPADADAAAIKRAFRKLAKENHPDTHPGDKAAEERFKAVSQAYEILSDPEKRRRYDAMRRSPFGAQGAPGGGYQGGPWAQGGAGAGSINELFEMFFGRGASPFDQFGRYEQPEPEAQDQNVTLRLNLAQALLGTTVHVRLRGDELRLKVPAGSQPGTRLRLKGKGHNGGDLYVELVVELPSDLSADEASQLRAMAAKRGWEL